MKKSSFERGYMSTERITLHGCGVGAHAQPRLPAVDAGNGIHTVQAVVRSHEQIVARAVNVDGPQ